MHTYIMSLKHTYQRFMRSTAGHDVVMGVAVSVFLVCASTALFAAPFVFGTSLPASVCGTSSTVFTTFAADRAC